MITNLPQSQQLLQNPNIILHNLILPRQIRKLGFRLSEVLVVNLHFGWAHFKSDEFIFAGWESEDTLAIWRPSLFSTAESDGVHDSAKTDDALTLTVFGWSRDIFCPYILVIHGREAKELDEREHVIQFVLNRGASKAKSPVGNEIAGCSTANCLDFFNRT